MGSYVLTRGPVVRRAILLVLVGGLPLLFWRPALDPFNVPKFAVLVFAVVLVAAIRIFELLQGADRAGLRELVAPAVALLGPLALAWAFSPYKWFTLFGRQGRLQGLIPYLIVVLFGLLLADAFRASPRPIMWAMAVAAAGVTLYSGIQYLEADPFDWVLDANQTKSAVSTLGNPNFTGGFLGMSLPVIAVLWVITPRHRKPLGFLFLAAAGSLVFTGSQGGWAAGIAGMCIVAGFLLVGRVSMSRRLGYAAAAAAALIAIAAVIAGQLGVPGIPESATLRGNWWRAAGQMSVQSPVVGRGPSGFAVDGVRYRDEEEAVHARFTFPDDPHSVPLAFLAAGGVIGLAGFVFVAFWAFRRGVSLGDDDLIGAAFFALIAAYFTQSLVSIDEVILRMSLWIGLAGLIAAQAASAARSSKKATKTPGAKNRRQAQPATRLRAAPALIPLVALVAAAGWWSYGYLSADLSMKKGVAAFSDGAVDEGRQHMADALGFRLDYGYQELYAGALSDAATDEEDVQLFEAAESAYGPLESWPDVGALVQHARMKRAWAEIDSEQGDDVMPLYRQALAIDYRNPALKAEVAEVLVALDRPDEAVELLGSSADVVDGSMPEFWGIFGLALAEIGEDAEARQAIDRALSEDPEQEHALEAREILS